MPVKIAETLPARKILESENFLVIGQNRASDLEICSLKIAILNLMPTKVQTETQLLRLLGNTPLQVEITLLQPSTYQSKNTPAEHLLSHYLTFEEVVRNHYDGLIITGAPVEHLPFEEVEYWEELKAIIDWADRNVSSTLFICWAAQAGLYHRYGIPKYPLAEKIFGVFPHQVRSKKEKLLRGFDDIFFAPHSRNTEIKVEDLSNFPDLMILAESSEAGLYLVASADGRRVYVTGHSEYDPLTLKHEFDRDLSKGQPINIPKNYFPADDQNKPPVVTWRSHAYLLFSNWLNYCVFPSPPPPDYYRPSLRGDMFASFD
jgi:homoserine O-succinyltransferase/O-acetyltransferase